MLLECGTFVLGCIFLLSGAAKLLDPSLALQTVQTVFVELVARPAVYVSATIEMLLAAMLLVSYRWRAALATCVFVLLVFTAVLVLAKLRGHEGSCGCFGSLIQETNRSAALRNFLLVAGSGVLFFLAPQSAGCKQEFLCERMH